MFFLFMVRESALFMKILTLKWSFNDQVLICKCSFGFGYYCMCPFTDNVYMCITFRGSFLVTKLVIIANVIFHDCLSS